MVRRAVDAHAVIVAVRPQRVRAKEARLEVDWNWRLAGQLCSQGVENRPVLYAKQSGCQDHPRGQFPNGSGPLRSARATTRREPGSDLLARTDEWTGPSRPIRARTT